MHCHHDNAVGVLIVIIEVGVERDVGEEAFKRLVAGLFHVAYDAGLYLAHVFGAGGVLDGVLLFERAQITCLVKQLIEQRVG